MLLFNHIASAIQLRCLYIVFVTLCLMWLALIDVRQQILPDSANYLLLWGGLLASCWHVFIDPSMAIISVIITYGLFWILGWVYFRLRGYAGIGEGDYKLAAALAAWLGWPKLPWLLLGSSLLALCVVGIKCLVNTYDRHQRIAFGPYLAIVGWGLLVYFAWF